MLKEFDLSCKESNGRRLGQSLINGIWSGRGTETLNASGLCIMSKKQIYCIFMQMSLKKNLG